MVWILDGIEKLPADYEWLYSYGGPGKTSPADLKKVGIRFKDIEFRWNYDEADLRTFQHETNPDSTHKLSILFGPYNVLANQWHEIMPDTWGATAVSGDSNDCQEEGYGEGTTFYDDGVAAQYDSGNLWLDGSNEGSGWMRYVGLRWTPDLGSGAAIASIGPGSEISLDNVGNENGSNTRSVTTKAEDVGDSSVFSAANKPSGMGLTTADGEDDPISIVPVLPDPLVIGVDDIVNELCVTDSHTYNNSEGMSFVLEANDPAEFNNSAHIGYDVGHATGSPATLKIIYTTAAGGRTTKNTDAFPLGHEAGISFRM
jgi:hypothetical protein